MAGASAVRHLQTGFLAGETDPLMSGRIETDHYSYGLEKAENFACVNEGPIVKRPGFEYICPADPSSSWLGTFKYSIDQQYMIEWGEHKARFFTNGGRIETAPGVAYEVATPYAAADAPRLSTEQSHDRLYIDHAGYPPAALARTGAATFSHANTVQNNGPFLDQNKDEGVTVTASAASGAGITLTASSAIFAAGDVGALFRLEAKDYRDVKSWEAGMQGLAAGDKVRSDGKVYVDISGGTTGSNPPTHTAGQEWDGAFRNDLLNNKGPYGVLWEFLHDRFGIVRITGFTSSTSVTADVVRRLPDQVVSAGTWRWAHAAFSQTRGWPAIVINAFGRQLHFKDFDVLGTVVGDYGGGQNNWQAFTSSGLLAADLAFRRTLSTNDLPHWAVADNDRVLLGSASTELAIGAINSSTAVTGDNIKASPQSRYGSEAVFPLQVGTNTVFVELGGRRLRAADFDFGRDRYVPVDLTASARHITKGGVIQLAYQRVPFNLVYGVRGDGALIAHADTRLDVKGLSRTVLANSSGYGARVVSAAAIIGADNKTDELWVLVERDAPAGAKREIWRQTAWRDVGDDQREAFFVDCGTRVEAAGGQRDFTGFTHLAGQAVAVLAGGGVVNGVSVDGAGAFSLPGDVPSSAYTLIVGLAYTAEAVLLRPPAKGRIGFVQGLKQRARKVVLRLLETIGIKAGGFDEKGLPKPLENLIDRPASADMDNPIPLFTGDTPGAIDSEINRDGRVRFVSADPLPAVVTAAMISLEVDDDDA